MSLREGLAQWRRMGPAAGSAAALRLLVRRPRERLRRERLRRRPLGASTAAVAEALGGRTPVAALRGPVLDAMPTVAAFERELDTMHENAANRMLTSLRRFMERPFADRQAISKCKRRCSTLSAMLRQRTGWKTYAGRC